jgi:sporulation protein YlmC with PRC-barrel domain
VISTEELGDLLDAEIVDQAGERIGRLDQLYLDNITGDPAWVRVRTGWLGGGRALVPVSNAEVVEGRIQVPYPEEQVRTAPEVQHDGQLTADDEERLHTHYARDPEDIATDPDEQDPAPGHPMTERGI